MQHGAARLFPFTRNIVRGNNLQPYGALYACRKALRCQNARRTQQAAFWRRGADAAAAPPLHARSRMPESTLFSSSSAAGARCRGVPRPTASHCAAPSCLERCWTVRGTGWDGHSNVVVPAPAGVQRCIGARAETFPACVALSDCLQFQPRFKGLLVDAAGTLLSPSEPAAEVGHALFTSPDLLLGQLWHGKHVLCSCCTCGAPKASYICQIWRAGLPQRFRVLCQLSAASTCGTPGQGAQTSVFCGGRCTYDMPSSMGAP